MFIVSGTYKVKPGMRDAFVKEIRDQGIYAEFLKEKGNISYDYYYPCGNGADVFFVERWTDREAWDAHKETPHVVKLQDIKTAYVTGFQPGLLGELQE